MSLLCQISNRNLVSFHLETRSRAKDMIQSQNLPSPTCVYWVRSKILRSLCDSNKLARWEMQDTFDLLWQCKGWFIDDVLEVQEPTEVHHISSVCVQQHQSLSCSQGCLLCELIQGQGEKERFSHNKIHWSGTWKHGAIQETVSNCRKTQISLVSVFFLATKV